MTFGHPRKFYNSISKNLISICYCYSTPPLVVPVIAAPVPKIEVREHKNISLECLVTGDPAPAVSWFKVIQIFFCIFLSKTDGSLSHNKSVF